jgi:hypothetical protein
VAFTAAEWKQLEASDAMEIRAHIYRNVTQGLEIGPKIYMECKKHFMRRLVDAAKTN